jgi:hypothetical protein
MNYFGANFSSLFSGLCIFGVFAGDNPSFGCDSAALGVPRLWAALVNTRAGQEVI